MKFSTKDIADIIAAYAAGGISHETLAQRYGVTRSAITRLLAANKDEVERQIAAEKEKASKTALEWVIRRRSRAQSLIDAFLDITPEMIRKTSVRDRMGAVKILTETFLVHRDGEDEEDKKIDICISVQDLTAKEENGEG